VSGISQAISASATDTVFHAIRIARNAGVKVAYDPNLRLKLWPLDRARAIIMATIPLADYFLPSLDDVRLVSGLDDPVAILDWCHRRGATTVVLKLGREGSLVSDGNQRTSISAYPVNAVDATGAGDCFDGSFLARLAVGDDPFSAARWASAAAAITTTGYGAVAPLPTTQQVARFMDAAPTCSG
jgi:2-dehydro-3-deoxygluconokinase